MSSKPRLIYTDRDRAIHAALRLAPLDARQLLKFSETFDRPFTTDRKVRERMQEHQAAGWTTTRVYATAGVGLLNYYQLAPAGHRLLAGPASALPQRSFFRPVAPALQRHTRDLADVIVHTAVHARRLGCPLADQLGDRQCMLTLGERAQRPDHAFRIVTREGAFTFYDELDEATEPIASQRQRESLEGKIRFHEDYQNATGARYRVRFLFARPGSRLQEFLRLARQYATRQRTIFYAVPLQEYLCHEAPLTSPLFLDHFGRRQALVPTSATRHQLQLPTVAEMLADPLALC